MRLAAILAIIVGALMCIPAHLPVQAQGGYIVLTDNADVTGANAAVQAASTGFARYVDAFAPSGNGAVIRCGSSTVSATVGKPVAAGGAYHWQAMPADQRYSTSQNLYSLSTLYCYVSTGDKVNFSWAN